MVLEAVSTTYGCLTGRDSLHLSSIEIGRRKLELRARLNLSVTSNPLQGGGWCELKIHFERMFFFECVDLDLCPWERTSSLDEDIDSNWIKQSHFVPVQDEKLRHFNVWMYDGVFRVAAREMVISDIFAKTNGSE